MCVVFNVKCIWLYIINYFSLIWLYMFISWSIVSLHYKNIIGWVEAAVFWTSPLLFDVGMAQSNQSSWNLSPFVWLSRANIILVVRHGTYHVHYYRLIVVSQPQICLVPYVCIEDLFQKKKKPWTWVKTKGYDTTPLKEKDIQVIIKVYMCIYCSIA
jgi:hypothetical protein